MHDYEIVAPVTGHCLGWAVANGQMVGDGQLLGEIMDAVDGRAVTLYAPAAGRVRHSIRRGDGVQRGEVVATVRGAAPPSVAPPVAPPAPTRAAAPSVPVPAAALPVAAPVAAPSVPAPAVAARRPRIVRHRAQLRDDQVMALSRLVEHLGGGGYDRSELERLAVDLLLGLSHSDLQRRIEAQRDDEQQRRFGYGSRPR